MEKPVSSGPHALSGLPGDPSGLVHPFFPTFPASTQVQSTGLTGVCPLLATKLVRTKECKKRLHSLGKLQKLSTIAKRSPSCFWKTIKSMIHPKRKTGKSITAIEWIEHFRGLLNGRSQNNLTDFEQYVKASLPVIERPAGPDGPLDCQIEAEETAESIECLKSGKYPGTDMILNEMLKSAQHLIT